MSRVIADLSFMHVFGTMRAAYESVLDIGTNRVMRAVIDRLEGKLPIGDEDLAALRNMMRALIAERLLELLRAQTAETEPDAVAHFQVTARAILIELLDHRT